MEETITLNLNKKQIDLIIDALDTYCYTASSVLSYDEMQVLNMREKSIYDMIPDKFK